MAGCNGRKRLASLLGPLLVLVLPLCADSRQLKHTASACNSTTPCPTSGQFYWCPTNNGCRATADGLFPDCPEQCLYTPPTTTISGSCSIPNRCPTSGIYYACTSGRAAAGCRPLADGPFPAVDCAEQCTSDPADIPSPDCTINTTCPEGTLGYFCSAGNSITGCSHTYKFSTADCSAQCRVGGTPETGRWQVVSDEYGGPTFYYVWNNFNRRSPGFALDRTTGDIFEVFQEAGNVAGTSPNTFVTRTNTTSGASAGLPSPGLLAYAFDVAVSPTGVAYFAYLDRAQDPRVLTVKALVNGSWSTVGAPAISQGAIQNPPVLAFAGATPLVAYAETAGDVYVKRYDGSVWVAQGTAVFSSTSAMLALAVDAAGAPWVAFRDPASADGATVKRFANGAWQTVGAAGLSSAAILDVQLAFGSDGAATLYFRTAQGGAFRQWNGSAWVKLGGADMPDITSELSLAVSPTNGQPYFAYAVNNGISVKTFTSGAWSLVGAAGLPLGTSNDPSVARLYLSLDNDGTPYVAHFAPASFWVLVHKHT